MKRFFKNLVRGRAEERLKPFFEYIKEVGATDPIAVVLRRPSLLGLDPKEGLGRIVGWLKVRRERTKTQRCYMVTCYMLHVTLHA